MFGQPVPTGWPDRPASTAESLGERSRRRLLRRRTADRNRTTEPKVAGEDDGGSA